MKPEGKMPVLEQTQNIFESPIGEICEEDSQEVIFDHMIKLWIEGRISYKELKKKYPDYESSTLRKIIRLLE